MGKRGPAPKPTALKILEGNPGKQKLNANEPKPPKADSIKPPSWLMPDAKKEWKRLAPSLESMGVLTTADLKAFEGYCQAYARWKQAEEKISEIGTTFLTPNGYIQQTPYVSIAMQNMKMMQSFANEFGLTPASRSRINAAMDTKGRKEEEDPMEKLLSGRW
ncbi:MAG: phage terminase small subunit P27 family [Clostridiales bacterium]|nr:phage terminase small subunit P27 family [Clostridiales bacterium]MBE5799361.1 phage terminase small subunit P27 family [Clostridiales bacterium]